MSKKIDYKNAVAITRDIHWVGFYDKDAHLYCNPYLLIDDNDVVFFDPGSIPHFPTIMRKVIDLVNPLEISVIVTHHQDPDVCGNLAVVEDIVDRDDLKIVTHTRTIRLIRHYGLKSEFYPVEKNDNKFTLQSGRVLQFINTPYLHSPGAIVTYDKKTKTLFSSDIFGAMSKDWSLFAGDNFIDSMDIFHREYMPSRQILQHCMKELEQFEIDRILPQHGSILEGTQVHMAIEHLKTLPCGLDLIQE